MPYFSIKFAIKASRLSLPSENNVLSSGTIFDVVIVGSIIITANRHRCRMWVPFTIVHPIVVTPWILGQMLQMGSKGELPGSCVRVFPRNCATGCCTIAGDVMKEFGLIPHRSTHWPLVVMLPAFCPQIAPIMPVLPVVPTRKCCAVYYLRLDLFHGMEEVVGSIPTRSTI
ncbi:MAG TPA: hypothetical protein VFN62_13625 [Acidobacteriaceae bacterium]|nr:hypothetical protein [Acidobacteriaceae bacterium]